MTPNTNIVTDDPQIAILRPNLSDTSPEQNDPRTNPSVKISLYLTSATIVWKANGP